MFTGIVEEIGLVKRIASGPGPALAVACAHVLEGTGVGDSINVNGCCLTVVELEADGFVADMMGETLARTALGDLLPGASVNLERALRVDGRLGGHLVQGHIDGVAEITDVTRQLSEHGDSWTVMRCSLPQSLAPYVAEKGSITIDGVSLTVMSVEGGSFTVGLIPHTLEVTALGSRQAGDRVNLEADVIAKYVERLITPPPGGGPAHGRK